MKLNCDMGEGFGCWQMGQDEQLMPLIDMANLACGFHASDPHIMAQTLSLAAQHNVQVGAHPGYPDLAGFGRKPMSFSEKELINILLYQVGALQALCDANKVELSYIKPHGAMYNSMMVDVAIYTAIVKAVALLAKPAPLMIMYTQDAQYLAIAKQYGVSLLFEAFCDRRYTDEGRLQARTAVGSVYDCIDNIVEQADQLIKEGSVTTASGKTLSIKADTLCLHGDGPLALAAARAITSLLRA